MSAASQNYEFGHEQDSFDEPVYERAIEPTRQTKETSPVPIRLVKLGTKTIKNFVQDYPNSFIVISTRSKGLLRIDPKRATKYEVMFVPSARDRIEKMQNKEISI